MIADLQAEIKKFMSYNRALYKLNYKVDGSTIHEKFTKFYLHLYLNMIKYKYKCKEVIKCKKR